MHPLDLIEEHFGGPAAALGLGLSAVNVAVLGGQLAGLTRLFNTELSSEDVEVTRKDLPDPDGFVLPGSLFYAKTKDMSGEVRLSLLKEYLAVRGEVPGYSMADFLNEVFREPLPLLEINRTYSLTPHPAMAGVSFPLAQGYDLVVDVCQGDHGPYVDAYVTKADGVVVCEIPPIPGDDPCRVYTGEFRDGEQVVRFTVDVQSNLSPPWEVPMAVTVPAE